MFAWCIRRARVAKAIFMPCHLAHAPVRHGLPLLFAASALLGVVLAGSSHRRFPWKRCVPFRGAGGLSLPRYGVVSSYGIPVYQASHHTRGRRSVLHRQHLILDMPWHL